MIERGSIKKNIPFYLIEGKDAGIAERWNGVYCEFRKDWIHDYLPALVRIGKDWKIYPG